MKGEVAKVVHQRCSGKFWLINYSLGYVSCFVSIHMLCSCQCSTTIMKRMKQAILFGFLVLNMLSLPCLSNEFASHHILCLQESCCGDVLSQKWLLSLVPRPHLVVAMIRECSITDSIMDTVHPSGCG